MPKPAWRVLLIGGASGVGKLVAARRIGLRLGIPWLQVDDLRLTLERSRVKLPHGTDALYFFERTPDVWRLSPAELRDALIAVGEVMTPAVEIVTLNHVDQDEPAVIEGDGIPPSLFARPAIRERAERGYVRGVVLVEPDEAHILANFLARGRYDPSRTEAGLRTEARAKWLYGQWLAQEAARYELLVLEPRPWMGLANRILAATGGVGE